MDKAKALQKVTIRKERALLFTALDIDEVNAVAVGDKAALQAIVEKKRALRDATNHPALLQAASPDELKKITIEDLI